MDKLGLYTYIDGINDTPFPSAEEQIVLNAFTYTASRMGGAPSMSATAKHRLLLDNLWTDKVYVMFKDERLYVKNTPSTTKDNTDTRYSYEIEFLSDREQLNHIYFIDAVQGDSSIDVYKSNSTKVLFMGTIYEFADRLKSCFAYFGLDYTVEIEDNLSTESKLVEFEDMYILSALQEMYNIYEIPYYFKGKKLHIGFVNDDSFVTEIFRYGRQDALLSISRENANYAVINKIKGVGSADNIPFYYPNESADREAVEASGKKWITPMPNLMPSIYRESEGATMFYEAKNNTYKNEDGEYYVFENEFSENNQRQGTITYEDIKPSIKEAVNASGYRMDMFSAFEYDRNDNDQLDENNEYVHPYFYGKLRKFDGEYGFNLFDHAIDGETMRFSMTRGVCGSCEFELGVGEESGKNIVQVTDQGLLKRDSDGNVLLGEAQDRQNDTSKYEVWVALKKDNTTYGQVMPNVGQNLKPSTSDTFVILGITMPQSYILRAEKKLEDSLIKYMFMNNMEKFNFSVRFSRIFLKQNPDIVNTLDENTSYLRVEYDGKEYFLHVSNYTYKQESSNPLPEIEIELVDTLTIGKNSLDNRLDALKQDILSSIGGSGDALKQSMKYFLRKDTNDTARGLITFLRGIVSGSVSSSDFTSGPFGTGFIVKNDAKTGKSYIEADEIYIRLKAYFDTLEIKHLSHVGGRIVLSPASMECNRVEILSGESETLFDKSGSQLFDSNEDALSSILEGGEKVYRCYFNDTDGEKEIVNEFEIDDLAQCREFNIKENVSQNVTNQYYWRRVVGVGSNYIDLSITDCDTGSMMPKAGDTIVTIGNKTNEKRQNVVLLSSYDDDAPYLKLYSGVNSYSMLGKEVTVISPNAENNVFTGRLVIKPGSEGFKNLADAPDMEVINQEINNAKEDAQNAINAANEAKSDVSDLNSYVDGAFADGIITEAEAKAIEKYINIVENTSQSAEKAYNELYNNVYLTGSAKVALGNSYSLLSSTIQSLISAIETAISDGKTTVGEKESVDKAYGEFNQAYSNFTKCVEDANKAIQDKLKTYSDNAQKAADEAQGAADKAQEDANDAKKAAADLNTYIDGAFADGIVSEAEAKAIEKYINIVTQNKKDCDATYTVLYNNEFLVGTAKSNLRTAKSAFDLATSNLITAIQSAIADGKTTSAEKANVDSKYSTFYTNYASLSTAIEGANKSIQERIKKLAVEEAAENAIEEANKVSEAAKNEMAVNMGYSNYEALESAAKRGETVVQGGMINTKLINAMAIVTSQLIANAIKTNTLNVNNKFIINTDGSVVTEGQHTSRGTKTVMTIDNGFLRVTYNGSEVARLSVNQDTGLPTLVLTYGSRIASIAPNMLSFTGSNSSLRLDPTLLGSGIIKKNTDGTLYVEEQQYNYITISVNVSPSGAGRTYPYEGSALVLSGSSESVQAIANEGYEFERWSDGGEQTHNVVWSSGMKLTAYFREKAKPKYIVFTLANPSSGGKVSGGGIYEEGTIRTVTASANEGYRFVRWSDGGAQSHSVKWDENKVLTAYFEAYSINTQEILTADILDLSKWNTTGDSEVSTYNVGSTKNVMLNFGSGSSISFSKGLLLGKIKAGHRYELTMNFITTSDAGWYIVVGTDSKLLDTSWVGGLSEDTKGEYKQIKINAIATRNSNINDALWFLGGDVIFIKSLSLKEIEI